MGRCSIGAVQDCDVNRLPGVTVRAQLQDLRSHSIGDRSPLGVEHRAPGARHRRRHVSLQASAGQAQRHTNSDNTAEVRAHFVRPPSVRTAYRTRFFLGGEDGAGLDVLLQRLERPAPGLRHLRDHADHAVLDQEQDVSSGVGRGGGRAHRNRRAHRARRARG